MAQSETLQVTPSKTSNFQVVLSSIQSHDPSEKVGFFLAVSPAWLSREHAAREVKIHPIVVRVDPIRIIRTTVHCIGKFRLNFWWFSPQIIRITNFNSIKIMKFHHFRYQVSKGSHSHFMNFQSPPNLPIVAASKKAGDSHFTPLKTEICYKYIQVFHKYSYISG